MKQRYVEKDGKLDVPYSTDAAIPVYEWLAKLYKEGILDPNFATNDSGKMRNLFLTDRVGMITYWDAWVGMFNNTRKEQDPNTAFEAKGCRVLSVRTGKNMLRRGDPDVWVIPYNAEHPKTAFEFIEWWHSKDGIMLGSLGIKDNDYTEKRRQVRADQNRQRSRHGPRGSFLVQQKTSNLRSASFLVCRKRRIWSPNTVHWSSLLRNGKTPKRLSTTTHSSDSSQMPAAEAVKKNA